MEYDTTNDKDPMISSWFAEAVGGTQYQSANDSPPRRGVRGVSQRRMECTYQVLEDVRFYMACPLVTEAGLPSPSGVLHYVMYSRSMSLCQNW